MEATRETPSPSTAQDPGRPRGWRLATKLIVSLTVIVVATLGSFVPVSLLFLERQRQREVLLGADQLSKTIVSSTWNAMLRDSRDEAYRAMTMIGRQQGIERIRIFNKEGRVMFSSWPETGLLVDKRAEACFLCHEAGKPLIHVDLPTRSRVFRREAGGRVLAMVTPIYNDPPCSAAPCHAHPPSQTVLGVLDVHMSLDRVDREIASARTRGILAAVAIVASTSLCIFVFVRRSVGRPIDRLIRATRAASAMNLNETVPVETRDELGELGESFNLMSARLRTALEELGQFAQSLERKVEERTAQLEATRETLVRRDRLASLGQLSASVAHEINNPLSGVLNYTMLMDRILRPDGIPPGRVDEFRSYLGQVAQETARVGRIVTSLLAFARQSRPNRSPHDVNDMIRATLALVQHKLEMSRVYARLELDPDLPLVPCDGSQVRQVVMNLVMNAAESMPDGGSIVVRTAVVPASEAVRIEVADRGAGIAPQNLAHVFDPFFTTKGDGQGTGLGLTVVYGIVNAHGGNIEIDSRPGEGTTVRVLLPLVPPNPVERTQNGGATQDPGR